MFDWQDKTNCKNLNTARRISKFLSGINFFFFFRPYPLEVAQQFLKAKDMTPLPTDNHSSPLKLPSLPSSRFLRFTPKVAHFNKGFAEKYDLNSKVLYTLAYCITI